MSQNPAVDEEAVLLSSDETRRWPRCNREQKCAGEEAISTNILIKQLSTRRKEKNRLCSIRKENLEIYDYYLKYKLKAHCDGRKCHLIRRRKTVMNSNWTKSLLIFSVVLLAIESPCTVLASDETSARNYNKYSQDVDIDEQHSSYPTTTVLESNVPYGVVNSEYNPNRATGSVLRSQINNIGNNNQNHPSHNGYPKNPYRVFGRRPNRLIKYSNGTHDTSSLGRLREFGKLSNDKAKVAAVRFENHVIHTIPRSGLTCDFEDDECPWKWTVPNATRGFAGFERVTENELRNRTGKDFRFYPKGNKSPDGEYIQI